MNNAKIKLSRKLGLFPVTNIVVANIIGTGIFTTSGFITGYVDNPLMMLLLWFAGGVIAFCGAIAFGEFGANFPEAGGEYVFIKKLFNSLLGFLSGWLSLIVGFSEYFTMVNPFLKNTEYFSFDLFKKLFSIIIILIYTLIHSRGIVFGA